MQPVTKTIYQAFDGQLFDTAADCRLHEKENAHLAIVGLTLDQALAIARREDTDRADAVEYLGRQIEKARIAAGDLRRRPSQASEPEGDPEPEPEEKACITCGVLFVGEDEQTECDPCAGESRTAARDDAADARHEAARQRRAER